MLTNRIFPTFKSDIKVESNQPEGSDPESSLNSIEGMTKPTVSVTDLGKILLTCCRDGDTQKVHELMCRGAPFTTDWLGTSPIHLCAMNNHMETCEVLLRAGICKDARTKVDRTPLHFAVFEGHVKMVELLLSNQCEIDCRDMLKMTPLHWAVQRKHKQIVEILLQYKADPNVTSKFGKTPMTIAYETEQLDVIKLLEDAIRERLENPQQTQRATDQLVYEMQQEEEAQQMQEHNNQSDVVTNDMNDRIPPLTPIDDDYHSTVYHARSSSANISSSPRTGTTTTTTTMTTSPKQEVTDLSSLVEEIDDNSVIEDSDDGSASISDSVIQLPNIGDPKHIDSSTMQILKEHGISMIPSDDTDNSLITSALQSGRKLVLSKAGRLVLNDPRFKGMSSPLHPGSSGGGVGFNDEKLGMKKTANNMIVPAKNYPTKTKQVIKIFSAEQFKQMCGGDLTNAIKKISSEHGVKNKDIKITATTSGKVQTMIQLQQQNQLLKSKKPIMSKSKINLGMTQRNFPVNNRLLTPASSSPSTTNISVLQQSTPPHRVGDIITTSSRQHLQSMTPSVSITRETTPGVRQYTTTSYNTSNVTVTPAAGHHHTTTTMTTTPTMTMTEMEKQIVELRKITDDLRRQFELSQRENGVLRQRIQRLENERKVMIVEDDNQHHHHMVEEHVATNIDGDVVGLDDEEEEEEPPEDEEEEEEDDDEDEDIRIFKLSSMPSQQQ